MDHPSNRLFLDTSYVLARFNRRDQFHEKSKQLAGMVAASRELWTTDAVLLEVAAAFYPTNRSIAISIWDEFHGGNPNYRTCAAAGPQLDRAMKLFRERTDKDWSLTDCLSFTIMNEERLGDALSSDRHFIQAGFRALLVPD